MANNDFIISLLNLNRDEIENLDVVEVNLILEVRIKLIDQHPVCPFCGGRTKMKEYKKRVYNNLSIAGKQSVIVWNRRRYICKDCHKTFSEYNPFGPENFHMTYSLLDSIARDLKNIHWTYQDISKKNNVSSSTVSLYVDSFIRIPRLRLPENLGIDELHSNMAKYGGSFLCVFVDNKHRCLTEILPDRSKRTLSRYFAAIPESERQNVRYVTIDMWEPYKDVVNLYLKNAIIAIDPFHVIEHLTRGFHSLRISIQNQCVYNSPTYYLLKKWHKLLDTDYDLDNEPKYNSFYKQKLNYRDIHNMLLDINPNLTLAYHLKEMYRNFNKEAVESDCRERFEYILEAFKKADLPCYSEFITTLNNWKEEILNSFTRPYNDKKQSNALAEYINGRLRELIIVSNGYSHFERFRSRGIYCLNNQVYYTMVDKLWPQKRVGRKRGNYNK